jgi:hypothetical protein
MGANGASKEEANMFIRDSIEEGNKLEAAKAGVRFGYVGTNPSASKDVILPETATLLDAILTDNYPERKGDLGLKDPKECVQALSDEFNTWVLPAHPSKPKHVTIGPGVWIELTDQEQADIYAAELPAIQDILANLDGVTIWQSGAGDNPRSRILHYDKGNWTPRASTKVIDAFFGKYK